MSEHYRRRLHQLQSLLEPGLRRMLLLSFLLHLIVPVILSGVLIVTHQTPQLPVYRVNLVNKPVKNPRAGRPDALPTKKKKRIKKKVAARKIPSQKPKTLKTPLPPQKKAAKKSKTVKKKHPAQTTEPDKIAQKKRQRRLAEMQAETERQHRLNALKAAIAAQQATLNKADIQAPVGEPNGKGDEIGVSSIRYIEGFVKQQWRLSQYQLPNLNLQAEVRVVYSAAGIMRYWEFVEKSGNLVFDNSLRNAILKSRDLGRSLPVAGTFEIVFNLKDLQNR